MDIYWTTRTGLVPTNAGVQQPVICRECDSIEDLDSGWQVSGRPYDGGQTAATGKTKWFQSSLAATD